MTKNSEFDMTSSVATDPCPKCLDTHKEFKKTETKQGSRLGSWCQMCGGFNGWVPKVMTRERAMAMTVPVGQYKSWKVQDLPEDYQLWVLQADIGSKSPLRNVRKAIEVLRAEFEAYKP